MFLPRWKFFHCSQYWLFENTEDFLLQMTAFFSEDDMKKEVFGENLERHLNRIPRVTHSGYFEQ